MEFDDKNFWWECDQPEDASESKVHEKLFDHVKTVEENQHAIHQLNLFNAKLYSNRELAGLDWSSNTERHVSYAPASYTAENIIASVVDTVTALISKNWAKATPVTKDADFHTEITAQQADRYLYAEFKRLNAWPKLARMFNDACWAQVGACRIDADDDEIYLERVNPDELIVDNRECISECEPLQMHHRRSVSIHALKEMFPERGEDIEKARRSSNWTSFRGPMGDHTVVVESWYLGDGKKDGRHTIIIEGSTLVDEKYTRRKFPFLVWRWSELPTGWYGQSLVEQLTPFQLRMNTLNQVIQKSQDLVSVPRIFVEGSSKVVKEQLDNDIGRVLFYRGKPPIVMNWQAVHPEIYAERERIRSAAFEYAGISQLSAQAKLPDNVRLDSSKALREYSLRENERFAIQAQRYEALVPELAEHILELSAEMYSGKKAGKKVTYIDKSIIEEIDWDEVAEFFKKRRFVFQLEASSVANMTPAAREDTLNTWVNQGLMDLATYKSHLNHPDLEEELDVGAAAVDDIRWTASQIDRGNYLPPEPEQDIQAGIAYMQKTLLRRRRQAGVPQQVLDDYRNWMAQAQSMVDQAVALESVKQKQLEQQQMAQMEAEGMPLDPTAPQPPMGQDNFGPPSMGPEGNIVPGVASTTQGVPSDRAGVGVG